MRYRNCNLKEMPLSIEEVREFMRQEKAKKGMLFGIVIGVVLALVAVVLWVANRKSRDLEEHYEYFDEDLEDEVFDNFDEDIYDDESASSEGVGYVKIKDFMDYTDDVAQESDEKANKADEVVEENNEQK